MLNSALRRLFPHIRSFHIPCVVVLNHSFYIPIKPISASDKARFRARYGAFQPLKWAISHAEMVLFAKRKNTL